MATHPKRREVCPPNTPKDGSESINPSLSVFRGHARAEFLSCRAREMLSKTRRQERNLNWGTRIESLSLGTFSPFQARSNRVKPIGKTRKKNEHETSKIDSHSNRDRLLRAVTESASSLSVARRLLSRVHNS